MTYYALGKKPARHVVRFGFSTYFNSPLLPTPPARFGAVALNWGVLGNTDWGDCVWAGAAHEHMAWLEQGGSFSEFSDASVLSDYSAVTGFDPTKPDTDQGTDLQQAASYRRKTGILDAAGKRHTIDAYVTLPVGRVDAIVQAAYLMGACGVGLQLPQYAIDQFDAAQPWTVQSGPAQNAGGHYVAVVGRNSRGDILVITWGRIHAMSPDFLRAFMDEGLAYLDTERLSNNLSPQQFDLPTLQRDLAALAQPQKGNVS